MKTVKYFLLLIIIFCVAGCASQSLLEKYKDQSDKEIFVGGETAMNKGDLEKASEHFEALQALYPLGLMRSKRSSIAYMFIMLMAIILLLKRQQSVIRIFIH